jgi:hypothetical protein
MNLSDHQQQAALQGEAVRVIDPNTRTEFVVIRSDVFDRLKGLLYDDNSPTDDELAALAWEAGKGIGWEDPRMAEYDDYDSHRKQP